MGSGVSKKDAGAGAISQEPSPTLKQAISDDKKANELFDEINADGDAHVSLSELTDAVHGYSEHVQAYWTGDRIKATIKRFDTDNDGKLNRDEFLNVRLAALLSAARIIGISCAARLGKTCMDSMLYVCVSVRNAACLWVHASQVIGAMELHRGLKKGRVKKAPGSLQRTWTWKKTPAVAVDEQQQPDAVSGPPTHGLSTDA